MNIDTHQHFWRYSEDEYGWIKPHMAVLKRDYLPPNLLPLLQAAGFDGTVAVQARQTLEETHWLLELADQYSFIRGVVGWADLQSPDLPRQLEQFSGRPKLRGIRHVVQDEPDNSFMLRPTFMHGVGLLAQFDLVYDILILERQLPAAIELVRQFPRQRFVLNHIAKPRIRDRVLEPWATHLRRLAAFPNVVCKLSGLVTEANWTTWTEGDLLPYIDVVFEAFGPQRLMIGSDWPVCTLAAPYQRVMVVVANYIRKCSAGEQRLILGENATLYYGLSV
jgi:L-fuconolactonase